MTIKDFRLFVLGWRRDDQKNQIHQAGIFDGMFHARRNVDYVMAANHGLFAINFHQTFAFKNMIDLFLHLMSMGGHIGHGLVRGNAIIE